MEYFQNLLNRTTSIPKNYFTGEMAKFKNLDPRNIKEKHLWELLDPTGGLIPWRLERMNKKHTGTDTIVQGGVNIAEDGPTGVDRLIGGTADAFGQLIGRDWDFDRMGHSGAKKGTAVGDTQIGTIAEDYKKEGRGGKIVLDQDKVKEKTEEEADKKLDKYGSILKDINKDQIEAAMMMKGIDLAGKFGEGGMRAADSYDNLTRSIAAIAGALPQYNNPGFAISPMAYQDYAFGRG